MPRSSAPRSRGAVVAVLLLLTTTGCASSWTPLDTSEGADASWPPGCGPAPAVASAPGQTAAEVVPDERAKTAVENLDRTPLDLTTTPRRLREVMGFDLRATHTVATSGLRIEVYSDGQLELDRTALEELVDAPFGLHDEIGDRDLAEVLTCYERRIVQERELADRRLRVFVASDPDTCLHQLMFDDRPPEEQDGRCYSGGVTIPSLDLKLGRGSFEVLRVQAPPTILLAPAAGRTPGHAEDRLGQVFFHELVHHYDNEMGLEPHIDGLKAYEQRAYYLEGELVRSYGARDVRTPRPFVYVDD